MDQLTAGVLDEVTPPPVDEVARVVHIHTATCYAAHAADGHLLSLVAGDGGHGGRAQKRAGEVYGAHERDGGAVLAQHVRDDDVDTILL